MGSSRNVYIGAYLLIHEAPKSSEVDHCAECNRPDDADFCPKCGRSLAARITRISYDVSTDGFWGHPDWVDRLVRVGEDSPAYTFAISNSTRSKCGHWVDSHETGRWAIPDEVACTVSLQTDYAKEIARLRELGCEVSTNLGVLIWER